MFGITARSYPDIVILITWHIDSSSFIRFILSAIFIIFIDQQLEYRNTVFLYMQNHLVEKVIVNNEARMHVERIMRVLQKYYPKDDP